MSDDEEPVDVLPTELVKISRAFKYISGKALEAYEGKGRLTKDEWFAILSWCAGGQESIKAIVKEFTEDAPHDPPAHLSSH